MTPAPPVIYVAGPFRGATAWDVEQNVRRAEEMALELWRAGFAVICPHTNTRFFDGAAPDSVFLDGDLALLRCCEGVVLVPGWRESQGACGEVDFAERENIKVFYNVGQAVHWFGALGLLPAEATA